MFRQLINKLKRDLDAIQLQLEIHRALMDNDQSRTLPFHAGRGSKGKPKRW